MHRDTINNIISSPRTDYLITLSIDGHVKFWKKVFNLVEFAKNFKAHSGLITGASLSRNNDLLCTVGLDKTLKIFDVANCDLLSAVKLNFVPSCCEFVPQKGRDWHLIAVSEEKTGKIWLVDPNYNEGRDNADEEERVHGWEDNEGEDKKEEGHVVNSVSFHRHPIKFIKMNWDLEVCFSIDERAFLEVWDPTTLDFPTHLAYKCKIQTEFLQLLQAGSVPLSLTISPHGTYAAILLRDKIIRIFNLKTGKLVQTIV
jgi:peptidylprolyl isomerase domain and WD repeat-containing protein 1